MKTRIRNQLCWQRMKNKINISDPDLIGSFAALKRAARKARELSIATGTPFYIWKNGKVVDLNPQPKRRTKKR
jgi:hypothetical protein